MICGVTAREQEESKKKLHAFIEEDYTVFHNYLNNVEMFIRQGKQQMFDIVGDELPKLKDDLGNECDGFVDDFVERLRKRSW